MNYAKLRRTRVHCSTIRIPDISQIILHAALWFWILKKPKKTKKMVVKLHIIPSYLVPYIPCKFNLPKHPQRILFLDMYIMLYCVFKIIFAHCWQKIADGRMNSWYVLGSSTNFYFSYCSLIFVYFYRSLMSALGRSDPRVLRSQLEAPQGTSGIFM